MGRIRTIKPEFHAHEELSSLPAETHLFAAALVNYADDEGYFNANPVLVKAGTNPLRIDKTKIEDQLDQLEAIGYIEIRKSGIKHYGRICNFDEHQRVSHKVNSKIKERFESLRRTAGGPPEDRRNVSALNGIEGNREQGTGNGRELETLASTAIAVPASPAFIAFRLTGKKTHIVTEADVASWEQAYPAVDVRHELRKVLVWLDANEAKRSATGQGLRQRIVKWLTRTQDKGGNSGNAQQSRNHGKTAGNIDALEAADRFAREQYSEDVDDPRGAPAGPSDSGYASDVLEGSGGILLAGH
jgi:hypothetical protein